MLKRCESKLLRCHKHADVKTRGKSGKVIRWPWKITCGICKKNIQVGYDSDLKGRISYFDRRKSNVMSVYGMFSDSKISGTYYFCRDSRYKELSYSKRSKVLRIS